MAGGGSHASWFMGDGEGGLVAACGSGWWWEIVHGQWAVVVVVACVLPWVLGIICERWWLVVVVFGWGGRRFCAVVVVFVNQSKREEGLT